MKFNLFSWIVILFLYNGIYAFNLPENSSSSSNIASEVGSVKKSQKLLSRRKRYLAFPEESSLTLAFCETLGFVGTPMSKWLTYQLDWGVVYDLPNETWVVNQRNYNKPKPVVQRRYRRDLFGKIETVIESMGFNGRQCVLRALCETKQFFNKKQSNMVEKLLTTIFSLPKSKVLSYEHEDIREYDMAHRKGSKQKLCMYDYPECNLSLIRMALGEYSRPNNII